MKEITLSEEITEVLDIIDHEEMMHFDHVSDELWNAMNRLSNSLESADDDSKCAVIDFLYNKTDYMKPIKSVLYYSLIMDLTKSHDDAFNFIQFIRTNPYLSVNEKFFLHYQIKSVLFRKFKESSVIVSKENWMLFRDIVDEYRNIFSGKYSYIDEKDRNKDFVVVFIGQILDIEHGPTKTVLDRCQTIINKLKKKILLVNTAEVLSQVGQLPYIGCMEGNYWDELSDGTGIEWKGYNIPFFQCDQETPDEDSIDMIMEMIQKKTPYFAINLGGSSVIASMVNMQVPVITVGLGLQLDSIETSYQVLGRKLNNEDRSLLRYVGKNENHVIEGIFTYGLREQTDRYSREKLGIDKDDFVIVVVGWRLNYELDTTFLKMLENSINEKTLVVFIGPYEKKESLNNFEKLSKHFMHFQHINDTLAFMEVCDLYINPKRSGGGTSAVEAMSKGVPVITPRFGDVSVVVGDEFSVDDYYELEQLIKTYRDDSSYYKKMSEKAESRADILLDSDTAFIDILEEMAIREGFSEHFKSSQQIYESKTSLDKVICLEKEGDFNSAISMLENIVLESKHSDTNSWIELARMKNRHNKKREALAEYIRLYEKTHETAVLDEILELFYLPNCEVLSKKRNNNLEILEDYPYYYGASDGFEDVLKPVWIERDLFIVFDSEKNTFEEYKPQKKSYTSAGNIQLRGPMLINPLFESEILYADKMFQVNGMPPGKVIPIYLGFCRKFFSLFLTTDVIKTILSYNRFVIINGIGGAESVFTKKYVSFPMEYAEFREGEDYHQQVVDILVNKLKIGGARWSEVEAYYKENKEAIVERISAKKPKILFLTTLFSTAIQYHTRDMMKAAEKNGLDCYIFKEDNPLATSVEVDWENSIWEFKPDVVFCIDHFRFDLFRMGMPEECMWVTWIQDPMKHIMDPETPKKLGTNDYVISQFSGFKEYEEVGYGKKDILPAPVCASSDIYHPYALTEEEKKKYGCDICLVCHGSNVDKELKRIQSRLPHIKDIIYELYKSYQREVYEEDLIIDSREGFEKYIRRKNESEFNNRLSDREITELTDHLFVWQSPSIFRQAIVDWLVDAGYTNIKLYGKGWMDIPRYEPYAMGPAENGEPLSKIYQAAKISLGNNIRVSGAARVWETMLSGGFYLGCYVPPEEDFTDISKILKIGEDMDIYHNRTELLSKVEFYLTHEDARQEMIRRGRKVALEKMTYDRLLENLLDKLSEQMKKF